MQQAKSVLIQNVRKLCMVIGFIAFILFAFKAGQEVSNPNIAAGERYTQPLARSSSVLPGIDNIYFSTSANAQDIQNVSNESATQNTVLASENVQAQAVVDETSSNTHQFAQHDKSIPDKPKKAEKNSKPAKL